MTRSLQAVESLLIFVRTTIVSLGFALSFAGPGNAQVPGVSREQMWFAPTAEDWQRPVLITFQRTWEDAVAVARETGKPILICVNMDGEIASEHYAGIRYREPEKAALYEPYVCVIASVYRHTPRDYDEAGHRILCPRFGSVTCGEHIAIEPLLYEKFFDGKRIAPRHVMVELDGNETYDVYYARDTDSVFAAIRDGIAERDPATPAVVRGDRTLVERVASRDVGDRTAVEAAYRQADREQQRALLAAAAENMDAAPIGLLRLAVFGLDPELSEMARQALTKAKSPAAVSLISEALRAPMGEKEREGLIAALQRIGRDSPVARRLAVVHRGLEHDSREVDVAGWSKAIEGGGTYGAPAEWNTLEARADSTEKAVAERPDDARAQLAFAESSLAMAVDPKTSEVVGAGHGNRSKYAQLMLEDARRAALAAEKLGASGWRLNATLALSNYYLGNRDKAFGRAKAAIGEIPAGSQEWSAIATIALFAQARQRDIIAAVRAKEDWPGEWLTDVSASYEVLARHPLGTDRHVAAHYDFLKWLGATARAGRVLDQGLKRFPESWALHDCLRSKILEEHGVAGLEPAYEAMLAKPDASPNLEWFAGYTSIVAAEYYRRGRDLDNAAAAYDRAIVHYERSAEGNGNNRDSADFYVAVAMAGRARVMLLRKDYPGAVRELLAAFERKPEASATLDGLNLSAVITANTLKARLAEDERTDLLEQLQAALDALDPDLLLPPAYDTPGRPARNFRRRRGR